MPAKDFVEESRKPSKELFEKCDGDMAKFCHAVRTFSEKLQKNMNKAKTKSHHRREAA